MLVGYKLSFKFRKYFTKKWNLKPKYLPYFVLNYTCLLDIVCEQTFSLFTCATKVFSFNIFVKKITQQNQMDSHKNQLDWILLYNKV